MSIITARYVDTCLSSYLQSGAIFPGQTLCLASLGADLATTVEDLIDSVDFDAGIPEVLSNADLARVLRTALTGVDLRYIDEHGIRQEEPGKDRDDEEPYVYVMLEWNIEWQI